MSFPNDRTYNFDINLQLSDAAAAQTVTGYSQVGGANAVLDLGGNQGTSPKQQSRIDAVCVIDVTALDIASGDETYKFILVGSNDPALATGNVELGSVQVGKGAALEILNAADSVTGRIELMFSTNLAGSLYEYVGLYCVIAGTTPSITYDAFVSVLPEI